MPEIKVLTYQNNLSFYFIQKNIHFFHFFV